MIELLHLFELAGTPPFLPQSVGASSDAGAGGDFAILTVTPGPWQPGDIISIPTENAAGVLSVQLNNNEITLDDTSGGVITFTMPDLTVFGDPSPDHVSTPGTQVNFGSQDFVISDSTTDISVTRVVDQPDGLNLEVIQAIATPGLLSDLSGVELLVDYLYGLRVSGDAYIDWTDGGILQGDAESVVMIKVFDVSLSEWTNWITHTIPAYIPVSVMQESVILAASAVAVFQGQATQSESVSAQDSVTADGLVPVSITEVVALAEVLAATLDSQAQITEGITLLDVLQLSTVGVVSATEAVNAQDLSQVLQDVIASTVESIVLLDVATGTTSVIWNLPPKARLAAVIPNSKHERFSRGGLAIDSDFIVPMVVGSSLTYGFNWGGVLLPGEIIVSSAWEIDNTAFNLLDDTFFDHFALAKISGGIAGRTAHARNTITTTIDGETNKYSKRIHLRCIPG